MDTLFLNSMYVVKHHQSFIAVLCRSLSNGFSCPRTSHPSFPLRALSHKSFRSALCLLLLPGEIPPSLPAQKHSCQRREISQGWWLDPNAKSSNQGRLSPSHSSCKHRDSRITKQVGLTEATRELGPDPRAGGSKGKAAFVWCQLVPCCARLGEGARGQDGQGWEQRLGTSAH